LIVGFAVQTNCVARQSSLAAGGPFLEKPYTQLGTGVATKADHLSVLWHAPDRDQEWKLEFRKAGSTSSWQAAKLSFHAVHVPTVEKHRVYEALLSGLEAGEEIDYRVALEGKSVFQAKTHAMPRPNQEYRFVVFGDSGDNSPAQRAIANQVYHDQPSMVFITGDIVYSRGRISEYRNNYFPIYNADWASPELGAPLLRSILFVAAPGNHDILRADFGKYPDTLAYFFYWSQPLNGPLDKAQTNIPVLAGSSSVRSAFLASAQDRYPRLANFSFNFGNAHWTVLDANPYADWRDPKLQNWLTHDLETAKDSTWRFVAFHQPPFSSSRAHFGENQMRNICELLELEHVDVVFAGHVHNCQRTYPLHFKVSPPGAPQHVNGEWKLDRRFDGKTQTKPDGIIYLVTGAGGAGLNNPDQQDNRASWQEYTFKFIAKEHSYTRVDVSGRRLTVNQISDRGKALDTFVVAK
jgi:predicted phosphodiesterase